MGQRNTSCTVKRSLSTEVARGTSTTDGRVHQRDLGALQTRETAAVIARALGRHPTTVAEFIREAGGIRPPRPRRSDKRLSLAEREEISRGLAAGQSLRAIVNRLGRASSTVSREVSRNGGRTRYRALGAEMPRTGEPEDLNHADL
jgi:IS30 family transposase